MSHYYFKKNYRGSAKAGKGFSLVEFLITIGIVFVIMTVVLTNQNTYTDSVALTSLADEIGLTVSQAQAYGIGVKEVLPGSSDFSASFGLSISLLGSGSNKDYIFFADRDSDGVYDGDWTCQTGGTNECLDKAAISRGNYIDSLCAVRSSGGDICNLGRIEITFVRPSTEAKLLFFNNGGQSYNPGNITGARIVLKSPGGLTRAVLVYNTGQVSIQ